ncbi:MAG: 2-phospho-L-lactate guanylyltransferase [Dehalococcoidia bacterium]|nr:2-phospho-L-lactate guanylyltransferase [Dehalococcoidia bacterium]
MTDALIPVKSLRDGKTRMAGVLAPEQRHTLSLAMLGDLIESCRRGGLEPSVVSRDADALEVASALGATALREPDECNGLNEALSGGLDALREKGAGRALVILADVPQATAEDLAKTRLQLEAGRTIIAASSDGGTNVLGFALPAPIPLLFGDSSFDRHCDALSSRGLAFEVLKLPSLEFDLDSPDGLDRFLAAGGGGRTGAALAGFGLAAALA